MKLQETLDRNKITCEQLVDVGSRSGTDFNEGLKSVLTSLLYTDVNPKEIYLTTLNHIENFSKLLVKFTKMNRIQPKAE